MSSSDDSTTIKYTFKGENRSITMKTKKISIENVKNEICKKLKLSHANEWKLVYKYNYFEDDYSPFSNNDLLFESPEIPEDEEENEDEYEYEDEDENILLSIGKPVYYKIRDFTLERFITSNSEKVKDQKDLFSQNIGIKPEFLRFLDSNSNEISDEKKILQICEKNPITIQIPDHIKIYRFEYYNTELREKITREVYFSDYVTGNELLGAISSLIGCSFNKYNLFYCVNQEKSESESNIPKNNNKKLSNRKIVDRNRIVKPGSTFELILNNFFIDKKYYLIDLTTYPYIKKHQSIEFRADYYSNFYQFAYQLRKFLRIPGNLIRFYSSNNNDSSIHCSRMIGEFDNQCCFIKICLYFKTEESVFSLDFFSDNNVSNIISEIHKMGISIDTILPTKIYNANKNNNINNEDGGNLQKWLKERPGNFCSKDNPLIIHIYKNKVTFIEKNKSISKDYTINESNITFKKIVETLYPNEVRDFKIYPFEKIPKDKRLKNEQRKNDKAKTKKSKGNSPKQSKDKTPNKNNSSQTELLTIDPNAKLKETDYQKKFIIEFFDPVYTFYFNGQSHSLQIDLESFVSDAIRQLHESFKIDEGDLILKYDDQLITKNKIWKEFNLPTSSIVINCEKLKTIETIEETRTFHIISHKHSFELTLPIHCTFKDFKNKLNELLCNIGNETIEIFHNKKIVKELNDTYTYEVKIWRTLKITVPGQTTECNYIVDSSKKIDDLNDWASQISQIPKELVAFYDKDSKLLKGRIDDITTNEIYIKKIEGEYIYNIQIEGECISQNIISDYFVFNKIEKVSTLKDKIKQKYKIDIDKYIINIIFFDGHLYDDETELGDSQSSFFAKITAKH
ncbi:hypothetical protein TRFO_09650 [Tritrichomonas foetus]|uniref:Uncharacterized protein n=1 Tax=Tritrichomonas foetus TaxID=1144522 RepID=A0A1J4JD41_9EUKA|nr:hypothetical protein TRFO_09650 [Tritrichomonas foetus]|eukprot:OHS97090.1 hypothetical protein TRFO_09650 [Tritrichomonas foetus]